MQGRDAVRHFTAELRISNVELNRVLDRMGMTA